MKSGKRLNLGSSFDKPPSVLYYVLKKIANFIRTVRNMKYQTLEEARKKAELLLKYKREEYNRGSLKDLDSQRVDTEVPNPATLYVWANKGIISGSEFKEYSKEKGKTVGYWDMLFHYEIAVAVFLKNFYKLSEFRRVAKALRRPLKLSGGVKGIEGGEGFWSADDKMLPKALGNLLDRDFSIDDSPDLRRLAHDPLFRIEHRLFFDILNSWQFFESAYMSVWVREELRDCEIEP